MSRRTPASAPARATPQAIVGRASQLDTLSTWLRDVRDGHPSTRLIVGEPGIGKTALALALADAARAANWQVAVGRVYAMEKGAPYAVWSDAVTQLLRDLDDSARNTLTRGSDWLATICPAFAPPAPRNDVADVARLKWNFVQFLARASERRPLLLVLDNLQLADAESLELLHYVATQLRDEPVGIIVTYTGAGREENARLRALEASLLETSPRRAELIALKSLTRADVEKMLVESYRLDELTARRLAKPLHDWCRGNPYWVQETLRAILQSPEGAVRTGDWDIKSLALPESVERTVVARLERLDSASRDTAWLCAVIGQRLPLSLLSHTAHRAPLELAQALECLATSGILIELPGKRSYEFAHPITQEAIYRSIPAARAALLHANIAAAIEQAPGTEEDKADALAWHYMHAGTALTDKAARYLTLAGKNALARHANRASLDYLQAAAKIPGAPAETLPLLARAYEGLGLYDDAIAMSDNVRLSAERRGDTPAAADAERHIGLAHYHANRLDKALAHLESSIDAAERADAKHIATEARVNLGACLRSFGRGEDARMVLDRALADATALDDARLLAEATHGLVLLHTFMGPADAAKRYADQELALALRIRDRSLECSARWSLAVHAGLTGHGADAQHYAEQSETIAVELQSPILALYVDEIAIECAFGAGDWDTGLARAEAAIATARALNQSSLLARMLAWATYFHTARGNLETSRKYLDEAARVADGDDDPTTIEVHTEVPIYAARANYHLAKREYKDAARVGLQGITVADASGYVAFAIHRLLPATIEALLYPPVDLATAQPIIDRLAADSQRLGHRLGALWAQAAQGLVHRIDGDFAKAAEHLRESTHGLEQVPWIFDAARTRRFLADTLFRMGDAQAARAELRIAHDTFARLGAELELREAREMMRGLGVWVPPRNTKETQAGLSERELAVAGLVADGKSNKEIAEELRCSPRTVKTYLERIFTKLKINSREQVATHIRKEATA